MFCPRCGADGQNVESYCKHCGEWLPDIGALAHPGLFKRLTREEKIRKMRLLEMISAGLSLISAFVAFSVITGRNDQNFLFLALICSLLVAVYQMVNFFIGYKLQQRIDHKRAEGRRALEAGVETNVKALGEADLNQFPDMHSVTEHTTRPLESVRRGAERPK